MNAATRSWWPFKRLREATDRLESFADQLEAENRRLLDAMIGMTGEKGALRHHGVSLWRDLHDPLHLVVVIFGRRLLHFYGWTRTVPRRRHFYWIATDAAWRHLNEFHPEFRRLPR